MKNKHNIQVDSAKCVGCGLCEKDCPANNILVENKKANVLRQNCILCGHCAAICPKAAVSISGFDEPPIEMETQTVLDPQMLLKSIQTRRSIRHFTNRTVSEEIIAQIIEAGRFTPTGGNTQDVSFLILKDRKEYFEKIAVHFFRRLLPMVKFITPMAKSMVIDDHFFFKKAPIGILILSPNKVNGALAASNMALMAEACGLGVLYSGFFATAANRSHTLRKELHLNHKEKVVTTLVLGYSNVTYRRTVQKEKASVRLL